MVKTYLNLNKKSSSDMLITLFFRAGSFVKRGSEKELLELVLEEINRDSKKIIYHYVTNRELKELKERGFFNNSPLVSDSPFDVYSNEDLEKKKKKKIFEEVFI